MSEPKKKKASAVSTLKKESNPVARRTAQKPAEPASTQCERETGTAEVQTLCDMLADKFKHLPKMNRPHPETFREAYARLAALGFLPDETCSVVCPEHLHSFSDGKTGWRNKGMKPAQGDPDRKPYPTTTVSFSPSARGKLVPTFTFKNIEAINAIDHLRRIQPKKHSRKSPSLWDQPNNRPAWEYLLADNARTLIATGETGEEMEQARARLAEICIRSIADLDPSPLVKLARCVEALKEMTTEKIEAARQSERRNKVMETFQMLCIKMQCPPSKGYLRECVGLKNYGNEFDEKQFTRELLNPLGLHWLPKVTQEPG